MLLCSTIAKEAPINELPGKESSRSRRTSMHHNTWRTLDGTQTSKDPAHCSTALPDDITKQRQQAMATRTKNRLRTKYTRRRNNFVA